MEKRKDQIFYYDVIRAVACLSVIIIHFNASFSAWSGGVFTYPNAVFPNFIFNQSVYLGDLGVSLFFILSGAAIPYLWRTGNLSGSVLSEEVSVPVPHVLAGLVCGCCGGGSGVRRDRLRRSESSTCHLFGDGRLPAVLGVWWTWRILQSGRVVLGLHDPSLSDDAPAPSGDEKASSPHLGAQRHGVHFDPRGDIKYFLFAAGA